MNRQDARDLWATLRRRIASAIWTPFPASEWQANEQWHLSESIQAAFPPRESEVQKRIQAALAMPHKRRGELFLAFAHTATRQLPPASAALPAMPIVSMDWLNSKPDVREEMFADVVDAEPEDEENDETSDGKTEMRTDPALYRLQQMARAKQKGA